MRDALGEAKQQLAREIDSYSYAHDQTDRR